MQQVEIKDFLDEEYSNSALYQCFRSIANYIDGMKPSSRKVVYTTRKMNIQKYFKVSRFASSVASETEYLHGENSLQGVIVTLTQDYTGSNNLPILSPNGNFGSRFVPIPSAARYIYAKKSENFDRVFNKQDDPLLTQQEFEGSIIEPKFFVPTVPLLLVNGSEGVGTGFAQKILPRRFETINKYLLDLLETGESNLQLKPFFNGFRGKVKKGNNPNSWEIFGRYEIENSTTIRITELPIGYSLSSYLKVLKNLEENNIIKNFEDLSEDDQFLFMVKATRSFISQKEDKIYETLKLIKRVSENFTCIDEDNKIRVFEDAKEVIKEFFRIRLEYYEKRRLYQIQKNTEELNYLESIRLFVEKVISEEVVIFKKSKEEISKQLDKCEKIIKVDNSYNYLLKMQINSLTKEKISQLKKDISSKRNSLNYLKKVSNKDIWREDIKNSFE